MAENYFGITDPGKERGNNEDAFIAQKAPNSNAIIACVIDGVGGYAGGEIAAAIAYEAILERLSKSASDLPADLASAFKVANENIYAEKQQTKQHESMACVATLAWVDVAQNQFYFAHVGDTRLYLLRDSSLVKVSTDHSFVGFLEDSGRLTEDAAMKHPKRNEINKALGFENETINQEGYIETGQSPFLPGDILLICSDGLSDMVNKQEMTAILTASGTLADKGKLLIDAANHNGGKDNITVALVQNDKASVKQQAVMPSPEIKKKPLESETPRPVLTEPSPAEVEAAPVTSAANSHNNRGWLVLMSVLCLLFLAAALWQFMQDRTAKPQVVVPFKDTTIVRKPGALEVKLQGMINKASKKDTLFLSDTAFKAPLMLLQAIRIDNDTLLISGKGNMALQADSNFTGSAFALGAKCKYIIISNITLINFVTGITFFSNSATFKHVRFINCKVPFQALFTPPDNKFVNGKIAPGIFKIDSLPKKSKK